MFSENGYRKAQKDGQYDLYGFYVSNLQDLSEQERRTINLRYQIVELLIRHFFQKLEKSLHRKVLVSKEELPTISLLETNPLIFSDVFYLAVHTGSISEKKVLEQMNQTLQDAHIFYPVTYMHCKYNTNQENANLTEFSRNDAISLFDKVQKEGTPKYVKQKKLD